MKPMNTMKKTISSLALAALLGSSSSFAYLEDLSVSSTFAFESEYSFRGVKVGGAALQPSVDFALYDFYAGVWNNTALREGDLNEVDFYGGYTLSLTDLLVLDVGAIYYWFPNVSDSRSREVYIGAAYDVMLSPAVYVFYDFDLETLTVEASVGHSIPLADYGIERTSLDLLAYAGYATPRSDPDWLYYGGSADIVHALNDNLSFSVGVRYAGNDENINPSNQLWFGTAVTLAY